MNKIKKTIINFKKQYENDNWVIIPILFIVSFLQWLSLDFSSYIGCDLDKIGMFALAGIITMLFFNIFLSFVLRKTKTAFVFSGIISLILSVINNLVYEYHGTPFVFSDIFNLETALEVMRNTSIVIFIFRPRYLLFLALLFLQFFFLYFIKTAHFFDLKYKAKIFLVLSGFVFFYYGAFGTSIIPEDAVFWSFDYGIKKYGYLACLIRQVSLDNAPIYSSETYDEEATLSLINSYVETSTVEYLSRDYPDIIIILNESLYDLSQLTSLSEDNCLKNFSMLNNAIRGYAIVPGVKGGTSLTEYELFTNNSTLSISKITPFNTLDFSNANSSIFHLKNLGYSTIAMHPMNQKNYNRFHVYPQIGFDEMHFEEQFTYMDYWDKRNTFCTDESLYKNLINWYNQMSSGPRFLYALTIQNHALFNLVDESDLIITSENKFKKQNHEINEFLSCIKLSDDAFKNLIDYYKTVDRDVIICMVGDHAPYIKATYDIKENTEEYYLKIQSTPFIIWSNNPKYLNKTFDSSIYGETRISSIYLIPTLLESAGIPLSDYQKYLLELRNEIPVFTTTGYIYDCDGNSYNFMDLQDGKTDEGRELYNKLCEYLDIEYLNLTKPELLKEFCK